MLILLPRRRAGLCGDLQPIGQSVFAPRNLIASSPGLVLAAGSLLTAGRGVLRAAAVALVLAAVGGGGGRLLLGPRPAPPLRGGRAASSITPAPPQIP